MESEASLHTFIGNFWEHFNALVYTSSATFYLQPTPSNKVKEKVESVVSKIWESLLESKLPQLTFPRVVTSSSFDYSLGCYVFKTESFTHDIVQLDPASNTTHFAYLLKVLEKVYDLLKKSQYATKRELYYASLPLFPSQPMVDNSIEEIAVLLKVTRESLNIVASTKGLVFGNLTFKEDDGKLVDCCTNSNTFQGKPVPKNVQAVNDIVSDANFILIVEKETVFYKLISEKVQTVLGPVILITAKGIPDYNTRLFVRLLSVKLRLPVFYLGDCDPYGIEILCIYTFGCLRSASHSHLLSIPPLFWIGIFPCDMLQEDEKIRSHEMPLSEADKKKLDAILSRPYFDFESLKINDKSKNRMGPRRVVWKGFSETKTDEMAGEFDDNEGTWAKN